jgi:lipopolysaccharide export system protein LptA
MDRRSDLGGVAVLLALFICLPVRPVAGEETATGTGKRAAAGPGAGFMDSFSLTSRQEPIHIGSQKLEFLYNEQRIVYRGDVVATQGDFTLKSDTLTVTYEEAATKNGATAQPQLGTASSQQRLKEVVAEGNVEITSGDRRATGKKVVFNENSRTVVLSGDAVLREGRNQVRGERVTVFLDEKRSVVDGGAQMELIPEQHENGRKGVKTP